MSDYSRQFDFSVKDGLTTGNPLKLIKGSEVDGELDAVLTAVNSKYDSNDLASQAQAEAGSLNTVLITPLRLQNWADQTTLNIAPTTFDLDATTFDADGTTGNLNYATSLTLTGSSAVLALSGTTAAITGAVTTTGDINVNGGNHWVSNSTGGNLYLEDADRGSDEQLWRIFSKDSLLTIASRTDLNGVGANALVLRRTGTTVDEIELNATTFDFNGTLELSGDANIDSDILMIGAGNRRIEIRDTGSANASNIDLLEGSAAFGVAGSGGVRLQYDSTGNVFKIIGGNGSTTVEALRIDRDASALNLHSLSLTTNNDTADEVGFKGTPQTTHSAASSYPIVLTDAGKQVYLTGSATGATIPANASVAFPVGSGVMIVNDTGGDVTISITTDTMEWALDGTTGSRTLADNGMCFVSKVTSTVWKIGGVGLT